MRTMIQGEYMMVRVVREARPFALFSLRGSPIMGRSLVGASQMWVNRGGASAVPGDKVVETATKFFGAAWPCVHSIRLD